MRFCLQWMSVFALGLGLLAGCGDTAAPEGTGSLNLNLELADAVVISEVAWTISGNGMEPMTGTIDTSAPGATASVEVFGLPPGNDYLVELEATDESGEVTCRGDAEFDVEVGVSTDVMVMLNCKRPTGLGGVRVNGEFNICAQLAKVVVSPLQTSIGNDIDLSALGEDVEGDEISYAWTASGGSIADPGAQQTTYTCALVGNQTITVTVSDDDGEHCMDDWTVPVTCVTGGVSACTDSMDFPNGVAAGDVNQSSVVLWARATFDETVRFEYGTQPDFAENPDGCIEVEGTVPEVPAKAEVTGLLAGTQYYYRASRGSCPSTPEERCGARGSFRTPHASGRHGLRFGVSSCFRGDMRPFVSIKNLPARDLDFFAALGDIVYADSRHSGGLAQTLGEFRSKYKLAYREMESQNDNMFARARASAAMFASIDDHEVDNDFAGGAPPMGHVATRDREGRLLFCEDPDKGSLCPILCEEGNDLCVDCGKDAQDENCNQEFINDTEFFNNGLQAFEEYNPIREEERYGDTGDSRTADKRKLYRYRTFGKDAALFVLDTRSFRDGPDKGLQVCDIPGVPDPICHYAVGELGSYQPGRTMLGSAQFDELLNDLRDAETKGITWKFVLVPEPIQNLGPFAAPDRFEAYAYERARILDFVEDECIGNVVFVSGDIHGTIANNLIYRPVLEILGNDVVVGKRKYSSTWDISTGPVAYDEPYGPKLIGIAQGIADFVPGDLLPPEDTYNGLSREAKDRTIKTFMDWLLGLLNYPWTGLGYQPPPVVAVPPFVFLAPYDLSLDSLRNSVIPAKRLAGSYVATNSLGWTEFEIDAVTQRLRVTTYGIEATYDDEGEYEAPPADAVPVVVSKFEVDPRCGCQKLTCLDDAACGKGCICDLIGCVLKNSVPNGELCADADACASGVCNGICVAPRSVPLGYPCVADAACLRGRCAILGDEPVGFCQPVCGDGFCDDDRLLEECGRDNKGVSCVSDCGKCPDGHLCGVSDATCESGRCSAGFCKACLTSGKLCVRPGSCCSGICDEIIFVGGVCD